MTPRSRLHIPYPPARPGDKPDFSYVQISPAGAVPRPESKASVRELESLAGQMVRVLGEDSKAVGPWNPHLEPQDLQVGLRHMLLTRLFDDRMQRMQRQGRMSFYMKSTGEEAVAVAAGMALLPGDMLFPSYRVQGLQVVRGRSLVDLMCQCLSNTRDMCKGRQMPVMYHWGAGNIFSISGNLATQFPQAVGWAMAAAIKGEDRVAATWVGEGSSAEADFHHAMTFAQVYRAPVILNVVTISGRSPPSRALPAARSRRSPGAVRAMGCREYGWMAMTFSPSTPLHSGPRREPVRVADPLSSST